MIRFSAPPRNMAPTLTSTLPETGPDGDLVQQVRKRPPVRRWREGQLLPAAEGGTTATSRRFSALRQTRKLLILFRRRNRTACPSGLRDGFFEFLTWGL